MHREFRTSERARKPRLLTMIVTATALVLATPQTAFAAVSPTPEETSQVQGIVYGVAHLAGGRTVVGGDFTGVGSHAASNIGALLPDGTPDTDFLVRTNGTVYAVAAAQNDSVIYLGGTFTHVNGVARASLAAVDAKSGALLPWTADANGAVRAMEVVGSTLYVGGSFTTVGTTRQGRLVAFNVDTGALKTDFDPRPDWTVRDLSASGPNAGVVYASGGFKRIGGADRQSAAGVDAINGDVTSFNPVTSGEVGLAIDVTPNGSRVFFSVPSNNVFAYEPKTSQLVWTTKGGGDTQAIEATDSEVFIGGHFRNITTHKVKRNMVASLKVTDGTVNEWNPHISGDMGPWAIQYTGSKLVVGGDFGWIGGAPRHGVGRFDVTP